MDTLFSIIIILASVLLVLVVYVQNPKGGGLSSDFGAAQQIGGVQKTSDFIDKATWTLAGTIMLMSIIITLRTKTPEPVMQEQAQQEQNQNQNPAGKGQPAPTQKK